MKITGDANGAVQNYQELVNYCQDSGAKPNFIIWDLCNGYYMKTDWKKAIENLEIVVKAKKFPSLSICKLELAACYSIFDRLDDAKKIIENLKSTSNISVIFSF